jgi:hypothetical protein
MCTPEILLLWGEGSGFLVYAENKRDFGVLLYSRVPENCTEGTG